MEKKRKRRSIGINYDRQTSCPTERALKLGANKIFTIPNICEYEKYRARVEEASINGT